MKLTPAAVAYLAATKPLFGYCSNDYIRDCLRSRGYSGPAFQFADDASKEQLIDLIGRGAFTLHDMRYVLNCSELERHGPEILKLCLPAPGAE